MVEGLIVEDIRRRFGDREVLAGVSLEAPSGRITALVGENGAGKSTLFRILMGLLRADAGRATLDGRDVLAVPLHEKRDLGLGYLPQESGSFPELTVKENLLAILEVLPIPRRERAARLDELLRLAGLAPAAGRRYGVLSGGEQRRLEIAKALAGRPRALLLDEPFSGLDPRIIEELAALLRRLSEEGVALLLTDHNVHMTLGFVDHAWLLAGGRIVVDGPPAALVESDAARRLYLGEGFSIPG